VINFPTKKEDFHTHEIVAIEFATTNKTRLVILQDDLDALTDRQSEYEPLFQAIKNKATRTPTDVAAHKACMKTFIKELRDFEQTYFRHNPKMTVEDRKTVGVTIPDTEPSPGAPITEIPIIGLKALGGGEIEVRCKATTDQTKCSMPKNARVADYRYSLNETGETAPSDPEDCPHSGTSRQAKFVLKTGAKNSGKKFGGYFRWLNDSRARQEGPWTMIQSVVVG